MTTIRQAAAEGTEHLVKRGNIYLSLGIVVSIVTATIYITREVEQMRHAIEWNTRQVSQMLMQNKNVTDLRVRVGVLEARIEAMDDGR